MMHERYKCWLIRNKISSEKHEGNIDEHYKIDKCVNLPYRLTYSIEGQNAKRKPLHKIPINPDC